MRSVGSFVPRWSMIVLAMETFQINPAAQMSARPDMAKCMAATDSENHGVDRGERTRHVCVTFLQSVVSVSLAAILLPAPFLRAAVGPPFQRPRLPHPQAATRHRRDARGVGYFAYLSILYTVSGDSNRIYRIFT